MWNPQRAKERFENPGMGVTSCTGNLGAVLRRDAELERLLEKTSVRYRSPRRQLSPEGCDIAIAG